MVELTALQVPVNNSWGFSGLEFELTLTEGHLNNLMRAARSARNAEEWISWAVAREHRYFSTGDILKVCERRPVDRQTCMNEFMYGNLMGERGTVGALRDMHTALLRMDQNQNNPEVFTRALADFGKGMQENFITMYAALALAGPGVQVQLLIEGEQISRFYLRGETTAESGTFQMKTRHYQAPIASRGGLGDNRLSGQTNQIQGVIITPGGGMIPSLPNN
jgi:hypothetical protein